MSEQVILIVWAVAGGWLILATVVGLIVGRIIRNRDKQVPQEVQGLSSGSQKTPEGSAPRAEMLHTPPGGTKRP